MEYTYDEQLNLAMIHSAIFDFPIESSAELTGIPVSTIRSYRADPTSKNYRDWTGISLKKVVEIAVRVRRKQLSATPGYDTEPDVFNTPIDDDFLFHEITWEVDIPKKHLTDFRNKISQVSHEERQKLAELYQIVAGQLRHVSYSSEEIEITNKELEKYLAFLANKYYFEKD